MTILMILAILVGILISLYIGFFIGKSMGQSRLMARMLAASLNRSLAKRALKVIAGEIENKTDIEGHMVVVNRFITTDEDGKDTMIDLTKMKHGKKS